jgi:hypothetical protein
LWVADQTTVNRAALHLAPLVAVFTVLAFHAFAEAWTRSRAASPAARDTAQHGAAS